MDYQTIEERKLVEFMHQTGASREDSISCLQTWSWDLKKAITDYNDTQEQYTKEVFDTFEDNVPASTSNDIPVKLRRATLSKTNAVDMPEYRKISRGISRATDNINLVQIARSSMAKDYRSNKENEKFNLADSPDYTFHLPDIYTYPEEFRTFLEKDLIECSTLTSLQQSQTLNWWLEKGICRKLWPLATSGDGNCLLHAASLGMWGFHDRNLTLRSALHDTLSKGQFKDALYRRWRFQQTRYNKAAGFVYSQSEWSKEWSELVSMASTEPRTNSRIRRISNTSITNSITPSNSVDDCAIYESLEEIHILALAHVLQRTIIVISDTVLRDLNGEAMSPIHIGGIYFPFEIESSDCNRGPLILAYDMAHFSPLVPMETGDDLPALIPLVSHDDNLLPIQFCIDPGENFNWDTYNGNEDCWILSEREQLALLKEYLNIEYIRTNTQEEVDFSEDYTDEEFSKFSEAELIIPTTVQLPDENGTVTTFSKVNANNKAAKQLQSVAKSFGSIGKNMGKKIKKNIGSITRIGSSKGSNGGKTKHSFSTPSFTSTKVLCARLRIQRSIFQEEMIKNYLDFARDRFEASKPVIVDSDNSLICITPGCNNIYRAGEQRLCFDCREQDKQIDNDLISNGTALRYGTGNSKFYTQVDNSHHEKIKNLQPARKLSDLDQTLYLSNSTFYNDQLAGYSIQKPTECINESNPCRNAGCIFYGTATTNFYCSKCFKNSLTHTTVYPTVTGIIGKTNSKIMSDI